MIKINTMKIIDVILEIEAKKHNKALNEMPMIVKLFAL